MKIYKLRTLNLLVLSCLLFAGISCSKEVVFESDDYADVQSGAKSTLVIRTRAGVEEDGSAFISYPISIYVFDSNGKCVAVETVEEGQKEVAAKLTEGTYDIYAIAGASPEQYVMPAKDEATPASVISLIAGKNHGDLMASHNTVTLTDGEKNTLTLSLKRKVMLVQELTVSNVPSAVTAVSVVTAPLYGDLCIDGSFKSSDKTETISLTRQGESKTWSFSGERYMPGASSEATISIKMTTAEGVTSYSYTCADQLEANYKIKIHGTYTGNVGVVLSGTITGEDWAGERVINFDFDETGSNIGEPEQPGNEEGDVSSTEEAPAEGTMYKGAYVLKADKQENGSTIVTLITAKTKTGLIFTEENKESIEAAVAVATEELAKEQEITKGWRLPTEEEMMVVYDIGKGYLNTELGKISGVDPFSDTMFCTTADNEISGYIFNGNFSALRLLDANSGLRLFNVITFK